MADCGDGFMGVEERSRKVDGFRVRAQVIGIHNATGQEKRVEIIGLCLVDGKVDGYFLAPVFVVPPLNFASHERNDFGLSARIR